MSSCVLTYDLLDADALRAAVVRPSIGAVLVFVGVSREDFDGRPVQRLEYEAYPEMALAELDAIAAEVREKWPGSRVAIAHRLGVVPVGEASLVIAVGTPHRAACYEASRHAIEAIKARVPIWKREVFADGTRWKANTPG